MPKALSVLIAALSLTTALVAQEIQIRPRLVAGDEFRLEITRAREDSSNPKANYIARTPVTVRVVAAGTDGFIVDWRPGLTRLEGAAAADPVLGTAGRILGDVQLRLVLDADGAFERLANEAELLPKLQAAIDFVIRESQRGMKPEEATRAEGLVTPPPEELAKFRLDMSDESTYVFDRRLGLFREVTTNRLISGNGARRVDRCVIRLLTEPRR